MLWMKVKQVESKRQHQNRIVAWLSFPFGTHEKVACFFFSFFLLLKVQCCLNKVIIKSWDDSAIPLDWCHATVSSSTLRIKCSTCPAEREEQLNVRSDEMAAPRESAKEMPHIWSVRLVWYPPLGSLQVSHELSVPTPVRHVSGITLGPGLAS